MCIIFLVKMGIILDKYTKYRLPVRDGGQVFSLNKRRLHWGGFVGLCAGGRLGFSARRDAVAAPLCAALMGWRLCLFEDK